MTLEEFDAQYKRVHKSSWVLRLLGDRTREEQAQRASIVERYKKVREARGDLFEKSKQPLTEQEIASVRKRKRRVLRWVIAVVVFLVLISALAFSRQPPETRAVNPFEVFEALLIFGGAFGFWYFTNRHLNKILELKEKEVIKGVITDKIRAHEIKDAEEGAQFFELSLQEMVQVWSDDYKKYSLGDCVQIEILSDDVLIKRRINKTGQLPAH